MANLSQAAEMAQVLDLRQVWFTDLLLLGFDPVAQEDKTKVRFCRCPHISVYMFRPDAQLGRLINRTPVDHRLINRLSGCSTGYPDGQPRTIPSG